MKKRLILPSIFMITGMFLIPGTSFASLDYTLKVTNHLASNYSVSVEYASAGNCVSFDIYGAYANPTATIPITAIYDVDPAKCLPQTYSTLISSIAENIIIRELATSNIVAQGQIRLDMTNEDKTCVNYTASWPQGTDFVISPTQVYQSWGFYDKTINVSVCKFDDKNCINQYKALNGSSC